MPDFNPTEYGPALGPLLTGSCLNPLDAGRPDVAARPELEALSDDAFYSRPVKDRGMAAACRAGLWLLHNYIGEAHSISQDLDTPEGSYWHALVHRREPDFANCKYWFRRVGTHPIYEDLAKVAAELGFGGAGTTWDPIAFVDACELGLKNGGKAAEICRRVQRAEWELLFDYCWRRAVTE
jgi:hypothetical protein